MVFVNNRINGVFNDVNRVHEKILFVIAKFELEAAFDAFAADNGWIAIKNPTKRIVIGDGQNCVFIVENSFCDACECHTDTVISRALFVDDGIGGVSDFFFDFVALFTTDEITDVFVSDVSFAPRHKSAIAMLADNVSTNIAGIYLETATDGDSETRGIESSAATNHAMARKS